MKAVIDTKEMINDAKSAAMKKKTHRNAKIAITVTNEIKKKTTNAAKNAAKQSKKKIAIKQTLPIQKNSEMS